MSLFAVRAKQSATVLVCQKCFKRTGAKDRLSGPLKRALKPLGIKLVKTRCVGLCPKNAVVLHDSRAPRQWTVVREGTPTGDVVAALTAVDYGVSGTGSLPDSARASALAAAKSG